MRFFVALLLFFVSINAFAQSIKGSVVSENTGKPVKLATVFFDNTTIATETDQNGFFEIQIPSSNKNQLVVTAEGYDYFTISNPTAHQNLKISLKTDDNLLDELVIDKNVFTRKEYLKAFRYFFIGNTPNAKKTKIVNENDIYFSYDAKTFAFTAYSDKPLVINNQNLGYHITFHLKEFQVDFRFLSIDPINYNSSFFAGYTQFKSVAKSSKKIEKNRKEAAENSTNSFFRDLIKKDLNDENYMLSVAGFKVNPSEYFKIHQDDNDYVVCLLKKPTRKIPIIDKSSIVNGVLNTNSIKEYKEEEVFFNVLNLKTNEKSLFEFNTKCVNFDAYGQQIKPEAINFGGYFGNLKLGDMLPLDYYKDTLKREVIDGLPIVNENYTYEEFEKEAVTFYTSENYKAHRKAKKIF